MKCEITNIVADLRAAAVVPIVQADSIADAQWVVKTLNDGGIDIFEVSLATPGSVGLIRELASEAHMRVGVGSVTRGKDAARALEAGATFVASSQLRRELPAICRQAKVPCILEAMTPTEIARCAELQAAAVKLFPISAIGGPDYVRAIREIYPSLPLAPSGGIQIEDVHSYLNAGADFVGISSNLVDASDIAKRDSAAVYDRAAQVVGSLEGRQREHAAVA